MKTLYLPRTYQVRMPGSYANKIWQIIFVQNTENEKVIGSLIGCL